MLLLGFDSDPSENMPILNCEGSHSFCSFSKLSLAEAWTTLWYKVTWGDRWGLLCLCFVAHSLVLLGFQGASPEIPKLGRPSLEQGPYFLQWDIYHSFQRYQMCAHFNFLFDLSHENVSGNELISHHRFYNWTSTKNCTHTLYTLLSYLVLTIILWYRCTLSCEEIEARALRKLPDFSLFIRIRDKNSTLDLSTPEFLITMLYCFW